MAKVTAALIVVVLAFVLIGSLGMNRTDADDSSTAKNPAQPGRVVLLELFTSQGCSSCPPADRLLRKLGQEKSVIPVSYHVDYWNHIGWTDPFSSPEWSNRQRAYAEAMRSRQVYTPQLVVDGSVHLVGSDERKIRKAVAEAMARPPRGEIDLVSVEWTKTAAAIEVRARNTSPGSADVIVAIIEGGLTTKVVRGENSGRALENDHVVRTLVEAFTIEPGAEKKTRIRVPIDSRSRRERLRAVAFLQDRKSLEILVTTAGPLR